MLKRLYQTTLKQSIQAEGIGLHSGKKARIDIQPASANTGLVFIRADIKNRPILVVGPDTITDSVQCTCLSNQDVRVSTVEHLLAALFGTGVDNAIIILEGEEVPIFDGSSLPYTTMIQESGIQLLRVPRRRLQVQKTIKIVKDDRWIQISPSEDFIIDCTVSFDHPLIAEQRYFYKHNIIEFLTCIAPARTFGFLNDVARLRNNNLARGGSLNNAVVVSDNEVLNPDGLRFPDEFVRHKLLDIVGDFCLLGTNLAACITAYKPGHRMHHTLVRKLMLDPNACVLVPESSPDYQSDLSSFKPLSRTPNMQRG